MLGNENVATNQGTDIGEFSVLLGPWESGKIVKRAHGYESLA
jgi:hypothetical protein